MYAASEWKEAGMTIIQQSFRKLFTNIKSIFIQFCDFGIILLLTFLFEWHLVMLRPDHQSNGSLGME